MVFLNGKKLKNAIFILFFVFFNSNSRAMICDRNDFICEDFDNGTIRCQPPSGNFTCNIENHDWDGKGAALVSSIGVAVAVDCLQGRNSIMWKCSSITCHYVHRFKPYRYITDWCNNK